MAKKLWELTDNELQALLNDNSTPRSLKALVKQYWQERHPEDTPFGQTINAYSNAMQQTNESNIKLQNYWNNIAIEQANTAHQREVADLKAAGLNPWLSASGSGLAVANTTAPQVNSEMPSSAISAVASMLNAQTNANAKIQSAQILAITHAITSTIGSIAKIASAGKK